MSHTLPSRLPGESKVSHLYNPYHYYNPMSSESYDYSLAQSLHLTETLRGDNLSKRHGYHCPHLDQQ